MNPSTWQKVRSAFYLSVHTYRTKVKKKGNGIKGQWNILSKDLPDLKNASEESLENMEPDFMNLSNFTDHHEREMAKIKKKINYYNTERKYFKKVQNPNMLTWSEKEQIRLLHHNEPEIWTASKLSESFPATEAIIRKLILNKWQPRNPDRISKHDQSVAANWKAFKLGKLNVPDKEFENHLKLFTTREKTPLYTEGTCKSRSKEKNNMVLPPSGEFSKIITDYKAKCNKSYEIKIDADVKIPKQKLQITAEDTGLIVPKDSIKSRRNNLYTLDELRKNVEANYSNEEMSSESEKAFLKGSVVDEHILPMSNLDSEEVIKSRIKETGVINKKSAEKYRKIEITKVKTYSENYLTKIEIPKDKWKDKGTYRVKDCYYDEHGEFLYRVPGMKFE